MRIAVLTLLVVTLTAGCAAARRASPARRLAPCAVADGPSDAYCGAMPVWENRLAAVGRRIQLRMVVLPSLKPTSASDPVFVLAGGPGQGAAALADTWQRLLRPIQREHDIVLVDARGTGGSHPLACSTERTVEGGAELGASPEVLRGCLASYRGYADVTQYTTENAMDDLDDVREWLGYSTVDLYGVSYGSRDAMVYLRRHPNRVRAVVLDSVVPPENHLPFFVARDSQRAFDLLLRDCDRDDACRMRFPDLRARFDALLTRLSEAPPHVRSRNPRTGVAEDADVTRSRLARVILTALYVPEIASVVPMVIGQAERGDFSGLFALEASTAGLRATVSLGLQYSALCSEDIAPTRPIDVPHSDDRTFLGDAPARAAQELCSVWPAAPVDAGYWRPVTSDVPALLISGELDPVTPPSWGDLVAARWPHARHLVVPGAGHNASASGCVIDVMAQFLRTRGGAALETRCIAEHRRPPFVVDPSGAGALERASR